MEAVPLSVAAPEPHRRLPAARPVALALQGGGSLGAFAWGVLDRLLDAPELRIEMVSGTSAGAMNAAMLVQGLATGDAAEAKRLLEAFWRRVAAASGSPDIAGPDWLSRSAGSPAPWPTRSGGRRPARSGARPGNFPNASSTPSD